MAKWGEIKCPKCSAPPMSLWESMGRSLQEGDAREARLEARIAELEAKLKTSEEIGRAFEEDAGQLRAKLAKAVEGFEKLACLITEDAQAALDRSLAARFGVVRSEVVRLSAEGKIDLETVERLLVAIRKGGE